MSRNDPKRIAREIAKRNRLAEPGWGVYADHRRRVTNLLTNCGPAQSLCLLGAGNANDVDLRRLRESFDSVHLIDLDPDALDFGLKQQGQSTRQGFVLHGGVDISGALDQLESWHPDTEIGDGQLTALRGVPSPLQNEVFDTVASTGLITQLLDAAVLALGAEHPRLFDVMQAMRLRHLHLLLELLSPGGTAVLVTEIVSSDTFPQLPEIAEHDLPQAVAGEIARKNFFTGVNPGVLKSLLETDSTLAGLVERVEVTLPWRWQFTARMYAVCALIIRRKATRA